MLPSMRRTVTLFYAPHKYSYLLTYLLTYVNSRLQLVATVHYDLSEDYLNFIISLSYDILYCKSLSYPKIIISCFCNQAICQLNATVSFSVTA